MKQLLADINLATAAIVPFLLLFWVETGTVSPQILTEERGWGLPPVTQRSDCDSPSKRGTEQRLSSLLQGAE